MSNPKEAIAKLGLHIQSEFVPFSQSRNAKEKQPSLNWKVTLSTLSPLDGQRHNILTTDYGAGCAHAPSYKQAPFGKRTVADQERDIRVAWECEHGFPASRVVYEGRQTRVIGAQGDRNRIEPKAEDVIHSLVMDSDVLDAGGFESWARDHLGFDPDSRKAEAIYRACLEIALKLRCAIGESGLSELREAFQDY